MAASLKEMEAPQTFCATPRHDMTAAVSRSAYLSCGALIPQCMVQHCLQKPGDHKDREAFCSVSFALNCSLFCNRPRSCLVMCRRPELVMGWWMVARPGSSRALQSKRQVMSICNMSTKPSQAKSGAFGQWHICGVRRPSYEMP